MAMTEYDRLKGKYPDAFAWLAEHQPAFHAQIRYGLSHPELSADLAKQVEQGLTMTQQQLDEWAAREGHVWEWEECTPDTGAG